MSTKSLSDKRVLGQARKYLKEMERLATPESFGLMYESADEYSETEIIYNLTISCCVKVKE